MTWAHGRRLAAQLERQRHAQLADLTTDWQPRAYIVGSHGRAYEDLLRDGVIEERVEGRRIEVRRKS